MIDQTWQPINLVSVNWDVLETIGNSAFLSNNGYRITSLHGPGLIGGRLRVESSHDDKEYLADIVVPGNDSFLTDLCRNARRTKTWSREKTIANVIEAEWLGDSCYFQLLDMLADAKAYVEVNLEEPELWRVAAQLIDGLRELHSRELVHCTLAPSCVFQDKDRLCIGELWWAHDADGQALHKDLDRHLPAAWPEYSMPFMAPEMLLGSRPRIESDVYSLGATLFYYLTGSPPRDLIKPYRDVWSRAQLETVPVKQLEVVRPAISDETLWIVSSMLHPDFRERPTTFRLKSILEELLSGSYFAETRSVSQPLR